MGYVRRGHSDSAGTNVRKPTHSFTCTYIYMYIYTHTYTYTYLCSLRVVCIRMVMAYLYINAMLCKLLRNSVNKQLMLCPYSLYMYSLNLHTCTCACMGVGRKFAGEDSPLLFANFASKGGRAQIRNLMAGTEKRK